MVYDPAGGAYYGDPSGGQQVAPAQPSPFQTAYNTYITGQGPALNQIALGQAGDQRNLGFTYAKQGVTAGGLQNDYAANMGDAQYNLANNALQQGAIPRQTDYQNLLEQLASQMLGVNQDQAQSQAQQQQRQLTSQSVANGATMGNGLRLGTASIQRDLANTMQGNQIGYNREFAGEEENKAQLADRAKQLQLEATNLGMKPAQLSAQLNNSLALLGLNTAMNAGDLMDGLAKGDLQAQAIYYAAIQAAGQYATAGGK
jgi:hypothetical protein